MVRKLAYSVSEREHWISGLGGLIGIFITMAVSRIWFGDHGDVLAVSSMGSTAVLLFAMPHSAVSQPWPVMGGHLVSALVGVSCARWLGYDPTLAAALAVGGSITAMYLLRCLHPSGGATALFAVIGGDAVHTLGYGYVTGPVLLEALVLILVAVAFNYPFKSRRYPQVWHRSTMGRMPAEEGMIPHSSLVYALSQIDTFMDISEEDLQRIYELAMHNELPDVQISGSTVNQSARA